MQTAAKLFNFLKAISSNFILVKNSKQAHLNLDPFNRTIDFFPAQTTGIWAASATLEGNHQF